MTAMTTDFVRLRPSARFVETTDGVYLFGEPGAVFRPARDRLRAALRAFARPTGVARTEVEDLVGDAGATSRLLDYLSERGVLQAGSTPFVEPSGDPTQAYLESVVDHPSRLAAIADRHVLVVGCGGIGGLVAQHLLGAGIRRLTLIDFDVVQASNLNRQFLFTASDVGRDKLVAAHERLIALAPDARIELVRRRVQCESDVAPHDGAVVDAVVCAADTPPAVIREIVRRAARRLGAIFAQASVGLFTASWGPIIRPGDPDREARRPSAALADAIAQVDRPLPMSFGPTNALAAAWLARDLLHVLAAGDAPSLGCRLSIDFRTLAISRHPSGAAHD